MRWSSLVHAGWIVVIGAATVACGGSSPPAELSGDAEAGWTAARRAGCAACHGADGSGGVGRSWVGLYGSDVELTDGSIVVADDAYLFESIRDPSARRVAGYSGVMPQNTLSDAEIDAIVAYLRSLAGS